MKTREPMNRGEAGPLRSCLYECNVMHHRLEPKEHRFAYRIFMFCLDLDEIDEVERRVAGFSRNRFNLYSFRDRDHLTVGEGTLKESFLAYLGAQGVDFPDGGRILLVTLPRVLGYIFNPVSFYFCLNAEGVPFCTVAEVGNTFGEKKPFLLRAPSEDGRFRLRAPKHFYVSPFSDLDVEFDFKLSAPGAQLELHIDDCVGDRRTLLSAVTGRREDLTTGRLAWLTLKYPLLTLKVITLIHWHALRLWLMRLPFHRKEVNPHLQRDVLHPHVSLAGKTP
jgi:hypothetical protein